jgi:hypothetical protein
MTELVIAPRTKVAELVEAYPQLEQVLIDYVAAFEKLKNPVLRKTVARITSLQQAAVVGGVNVEDLVNHLRQEVGQDLLTGASGAAYTTEQPDWYAETRVVAELDATSMLSAGEQPVNQAIAELQKLAEGEIYKVVAPFMPAPLVDKALSLGFGHWVAQEDGQECVTYFCRE